MRAARGCIGMDIGDQVLPHIPTPELLSLPASELVTPGKYDQACMDEFSDGWEYARLRESSGLRSAGTFGPVVD